MRREDVVAITMIQVDRSTEDEFDLVQRLKNLYRTCLQTKGTMRNEWERHYRLTTNRSAANTPMTSGIRANEIFPAISARIAWMTDQEIRCSITPAANPYDMWWMTADILCDHLETLINSNWYAQGWYSEIVQMLWDASIYGAGFLKTGWDSGKDAPLGNVVLKRVSPWCLYVDPYATDMEDAQFIAEVHTMTPAEIERRFPAVSESRIAEAVHNADESQDHVAPDQRGQQTKQNALIPIDAGQGPTTWGPPGGASPYSMGRGQYGVNVYEFWFKENYYDELTPPTNPADDSKYEPIVADQWRV